MDESHGVHTMGAAVRDRQVLFDHHPNIRVILPTPHGVRSNHMRDLMPFGAVRTPEDGTQEFDASLFVKA